MTHIVSQKANSLLFPTANVKIHDVLGFENFRLLVNEAEQRGIKLRQFDSNVGRFNKSDSLQ